MKKTYINPTVNVVKIQPMHQMLTTSTLGFGEDTDDASKADARRFGGTWDDDEE